MSIPKRICSLILLLCAAGQKTISQPIRKPSTFAIAGDAERNTVKESNRRRLSASTSTKECFHEFWNGQDSCNGAPDFFSVYDLSGTDCVASSEIYGEEGTDGVWYNFDGRCTDSACTICEPYADHNGDREGISDLYQCNPCTFTVGCYYKQVPCIEIAPPPIEVKECYYEYWNGQNTCSGSPPDFQSIYELSETNCVPSSSIYGAHGEDGVWYNLHGRCTDSACETCEPYRDYNAHGEGTNDLYQCNPCEFQANCYYKRVPCYEMERRNGFNETLFENHDKPTS